LIKEKQDYREALERNGIHMPNVDSSILTKEFMKEVRAGNIYCPKYDDLKVRPCPTPPPAKVIRQELLDYIARGE
jgi:hypothetical protein